MEPKPTWRIPDGTGLSASAGGTAGLSSVVEADMVIAEYEAALAEVGAYIKRCLEDDSHFPLADAVIDINFYYKDAARLLWPDNPQAVGTGND